LQDLFNKFNNDWDMNSASGLAYNLITAMVPIVIALIALFGLTIGNLNAQATSDLIARIQQVFPAAVNTTGIIGIALKSLHQRAGILGILAILTSIFGGSRLFVSIEGYFDIIYRTAPRTFFRQNGMAILMMVVFLVLLPLMAFASSAPALLTSLATIPVINQIPGVVQVTKNAFFLGLAGVFTGLIICWVLFESIYIVVPNMRLSFRHSWRGAVVAAIGLEAFLALFPFYTTHFMGSYTGTAGFVLILLVFFYYFAVILLMGAEINAYFALGIPPLPNNIAVVLRDAVKKEADSSEPKMSETRPTI
jgi:YihY family inner membrane protein